MSEVFLLIGEREESPVFDNLANALVSFGKLQVLTQEEALRQIQHQEYSLIILDAAILKGGMELITSIRVKWPKARIVVLTASPTWRRAREALKAGAMDYLTKTLNQDEYIAAFKEILKK